jgi:hypothetical protein
LNTITSYKEYPADTKTHWVVAINAGQNPTPGWLYAHSAGDITLANTLTGGAYLPPALPLPSLGELRALSVDALAIHARELLAASNGQSDEAVGALLRRDDLAAKPARTDAENSELTALDDKYGYSVGVRVNQEGLQDWIADAARTREELTAFDPAQPPSGFAWPAAG